MNSFLLLCNIFFFFFWKKLKTPKRHFEIIWPLVRFICSIDELNWVFQSTVINSWKLKTSEPSTNFRVILSSIYLSGLKRLLYRKLFLIFDLKILNFKTRKSQWLLLKEYPINLVLGHRKVTIFICKKTTTKTSYWLVYSWVCFFAI